MNFARVQNLLHRSVNQFLQKDRFLIKNDIHEPSISHWLACYLDSRFLGFNVDCEYDGNIDGLAGKNKVIWVIKRELRDLGILTRKEENNSEIGEEDFLRKYVYPDVIVHRRGGVGVENNLLVVEVKKSNNTNRVEWDKHKLSRFTSGALDTSLHYRYGAFVKFMLEESPWCSIDWFRDGNLVSNTIVPPQD